MKFAFKYFKVFCGHKILITHNYQKPIKHLQSQSQQSLRDRSIPTQPQSALKAHKFTQIAGEKRDRDEKEKNEQKKHSSSLAFHFARSHFSCCLISSRVGSV